VKPKPVFKTILGPGFAAEPLLHLLVHISAWTDEDGKFTRTVLVSSFCIRTGKVLILQWPVNARSC